MKDGQLNPELFEAHLSIWGKESMFLTDIESLVGIFLMLVRRFLVSL